MKPVITTRNEYTPARSNSKSTAVHSPAGNKNNQTLELFFIPAVVSGLPATFPFTVNIPAPGMVRNWINLTATNNRSRRYFTKHFSFVYPSLRKPVTLFSPVADNNISLSYLKTSVLTATAIFYNESINAILTGPGETHKKTLLQKDGWFNLN